MKDYKFLIYSQIDEDYKALFFSPQFRSLIVEWLRITKDVISVAQKEIITNANVKKCLQENSDLQQLPGIDYTHFYITKSRFYFADEKKDASHIQNFTFQVPMDFCHFAYAEAIMYSILRRKCHYNRSQKLVLRNFESLG